MVNAIGYRYRGPSDGRSEWVFGGQVTLDTLDSAYFGLAASATALIGSLIALMTF